MGSFQLNRAKWQYGGSAAFPRPLIGEGGRNVSWICHGFGPKNTDAKSRQDGPIVELAFEFVN